MAAAAGTLGKSWMKTGAGGLPESDSRKVSNRRDTSNFWQGCQQQQQELTTRTLATAGWTAAETIGTSKTLTTEGRPSSAD